MAAKEQTESEKRVGSIKRSVRYKDTGKDLNDQLTFRQFIKIHD